MKFVNFIFTIVKLKIMQNNTLKEYYVKLEKLWSDGLNVLEAINKALSTNAQNVEIKTSLTGDTYKIPSFLYLENKLELLSNNFSSLFNLPDTVSRSAGSPPVSSSPASWEVWTFPILYISYRIPQDLPVSQDAPVPR